MFLLSLIVIAHVHFLPVTVVKTWQPVAVSTSSTVATWQVPADYTLQGGTAILQ